MKELCTCIIDSVELERVGMSLNISQHVTQHSCEHMSCISGITYTAVPSVVPLLSGSPLAAGRVDSCLQYIPKHYFAILLVQVH